MESRTEKHVARQDDLLLRAVFRVWKARERGTLMDRVRTLRLLKRSWAVWKGRMHEIKSQQTLAIDFAMRSTSSTASTALATWTRVLASHRNSQSFAVFHHSTKLHLNTWAIWRNQLLMHLKAMKKARLVHQYLLIRRAWHTMKQKYAARKHERLIHGFETKKVASVFAG